MDAVFDNVLSPIMAKSNQVLAPNVLATSCAARGIYNSTFN